MGVSKADPTHLGWQTNRDHGKKLGLPSRALAAKLRRSSKPGCSRRPSRQGSSDAATWLLAPLFREASRRAMPACCATMSRKVSMDTLHWDTLEPKAN